MPIRHPRLELRLHVPAQERFCPHQPALIMLHTHGPLWSIDPIISICIENGLVLQIRQRDHNGRRRLLLETQLAVPGHVLDGHEGTVCDDDHVEVPVCDEHAVRGFDHLWEDVLDRVGGEVAFTFGATVVVAVLFDTTDEDGVDGTFGPVNGGGRVNGCLDVCAVEVRGGAFGGVDELGGEGEDVPEEGTLLVDFVDVEAGVVGQGGGVDQVEDVAVGFAGEVEEYGWLVSGRGKSQVFFSKVGVSAGFVEAFEFGEERVVELEKGLVLDNEGYGCDLLLRVVELADTRVVD